jgi:hypothetical protein
MGKPETLKARRRRTLRRATLLAAAFLVCALGLRPVPVDSAVRPPTPFVTAAVHLETNATDGDFEVVFDVKGRSDGLSGLTVVGPDGRTVISFEAPDTTTLGMRSFRLESPEPRSLPSIKAAFPEGAYTFAGWTAAGDTLGGEATLSHRLPPAAALVHPKPEATGVATRGLKITWKPVDGVSTYVVKLEQEERGEVVEARIPADAARFVVPDGFLRPETEYTLGIGTVSSNGNMSVVETTFTTGRTTAAKK